MTDAPPKTPAKAEAAVKASFGESEGLPGDGRVVDARVWRATGAGRRPADLRAAGGMKRTWKCRKRDLTGTPCGETNAAVKQRCTFCGGPRPKRRKAKHLRVLDEMDYPAFVERFGEVCGMCGALPAQGKKLRRDHDHRSGLARGILCVRCNRALPSWIDADWLLSAADYLYRAAAAEIASREPEAAA